MTISCGKAECVLPLSMPDSAGIAVHGVGAFAIFAGGFLAVGLTNLSLILLSAMSSWWLQRRRFQRRKSMPGR